MANDVVVQRRAKSPEKKFRVGCLYEHTKSGDVYLAAVAGMGLINLFRLSDGARWTSKDMSDVFPSHDNFSELTSPVTITPKVD